MVVVECVHPIPNPYTKLSGFAQFSIAPDIKTLENKDFQDWHNP